MTRNVAVIGTGRIGGTLGRAFARAGHRVTFGTRGPADGTAAGDSGATEATVADALAAADIVVITVPGPAVAGLVAGNTGALAGKLIIDATNKIGGDGRRTATRMSRRFPAPATPGRSTAWGWRTSPTRGSAPRPRT